MYERFTDRARKVMVLANQEALRFRHEYIGTEHILLGLICEGSGVAANALKNLDIDLRKVRLEVEKIVLPGPDVVAQKQLSQTPRTKRVLDFAAEESRKLNHEYIGTEHLLLGLLREEEVVAAQVLMNLGLRLSSVRDEVLNLLGHNLPTSKANVAATAEDSRPKFAKAISALEELIELLWQMREGAFSRQDLEWSERLRERQEELRKMREWFLHNKYRELGRPPEGQQP
jgi:ATP-dependent Clp protease ATP-binding subunit ClpC